jgi:hypothetical protein
MILCYEKGYQGKTDDEDNAIKTQTNLMKIKKQGRPEPV